MKLNIKKLFLGKPNAGANLEVGTIQKRIQNIKAIWNNDHQDDVGIEKLLLGKCKNP